MAVEKSTIKYSPCKPPIDCSAYADDDYDPCEKTQEITDDDLAVLTNEERGTRSGQGEQAKAGFRLRDGDQTKGKGSEDSGKADAEGDFSHEGEKKSGCKKKPNCKKIKRNPFFTNRLDFSSDLPPRPATPPPQFFPLVEDANAKRCLNGSRKKKCRRKKDGKDGDGNKDMDEGPEEEEKPKNICVCTGVEDETCDPTSCLVDDDKNKRRKCPKKKVRAPCRKKGSDVSISLQPRKIPALQRDLPERCPKEEAIKERKLPLLCVVECLTKNCKKTKTSF